MSILAGVDELQAQVPRDVQLVENSEQAVRVELVIPQILKVPYLNGPICAPACYHGVRPFVVLGCVFRRRVACTLLVRGMHQEDLHGADAVSVPLQSPPRVGHSGHRGRVLGLQEAVVHLPDANGLVPGAADDAGGVLGTPHVGGDAGDPLCVSAELHSTSAQQQRVDIQVLVLTTCVNMCGKRAGIVGQQENAF